MRSLAYYVARWARTLGVGTIFYLDSNEEETALPVPGDWDLQESLGTPYFLGVVDGVPAWRPVTYTAPAVVTGVIAGGTQVTAGGDFVIL